MNFYLINDFRCQSLYLVFLQLPSPAINGVNIIKRVSSRSQKWFGQLLCAMG
ncbi:hypothetical protein OPIT5_16535 [Opitutaceae bacterium TAV5]|nr:hypothetical protein OPIT5_16535 [Opitutaceae bacterium TAV5]